MTTYLTMYDAVTVANVPADAKYAAVYVDGPYANEAAMRVRLPHATFLTITVQPSNEADCCDSETGDLTSEQAVTWVEQRLAAGVYRPCVYADASRWSTGLEAALAHYGSKIRRWVAAYPGTGANIPAGFDAHQYSSTDVDTSVCLPDFFDAAPKPAPKPSGTAKFSGSFNLSTGAWTVKGEPGTDVKFVPADGWESAEIQIDRATGAWRVKGIPLNSPPLGK